MILCCWVFLCSVLTTLLGVALSLVEKQVFWILHLLLLWFYASHSNTVSNRRGGIKFIIVFVMRVKWCLISVCSALLYYHWSSDVWSNYWSHAFFYHLFWVSVTRCISCILCRSIALSFRLTHCSKVTLSSFTPHYASPQKWNLGNCCGKTFTGRMPFLSPNQQYQSIEGRHCS